MKPIFRRIALLAILISLSDCSDGVTEYEPHSQGVCEPCNQYGEFVDAPENTTDCAPDLGGERVLFCQGFFNSAGAVTLCAPLGATQCGS